MNATNNESIGHYINGRWLKGNGRPLISTNPMNDHIIWQGHHATADEVSLAYDAAKNALPIWADLSDSTRAEHLLRFSKQVEAQSETLTYLIALETGKPLWEAKTETAAVIQKVQLSIQAYKERTGERHILHNDIDHRLRFKPHGVVAIIGPFNFPAHLSNGHIIPALLAGNTIVYKPSELTPAVAEFITKCWHACNLPAGVLNTIQGDANSSQCLLKEDIQGVYFTGSYRAGLSIHQQFAARPDVLLALEMGGNNPLVIDEIRDIKSAVYHTLLSSFLTAGQRCSSARRIIIPNTALGDSYLEQLLKACKTLRVGPFTLNPEPFMGPVISHAHALRHIDAQNQLQQIGGQSLLTMKLLADHSGLLSPGVIDMSRATCVPDEEIFAPLVQVYRYNDFAEALNLANQTQYGLSAALFSDSKVHYQKFYHTIRAGIINWNRPTTGAAGSLPFGGIGRSGNHRASAYFAADYCAYPISSMEQTTLTQPDTLLPGVSIA